MTSVKTKYNLANDVVLKNLDVDLQGRCPEKILEKNLHDHGSAVLKNNNVPVHLLKDVFKQWTSFFSSEEKYQWLRKEETDEGYIPINGEVARKSDLPDFKEFFQAHYHCRLPDNINTKSTEQLFESMVKLGEQICELLDLALPSFVKKKMSMSLPKMVAGCNNHIIRIIHYPPIEAGINIPRAAPHTDICLFTIVFDSIFKGLELQDPNGSWYVPEVNDSDLIVFNSDMIDLCTDGYLKSVSHRVIANPNSHTESRFSFPCGFHPRREVELKKGFTAGVAVRTRVAEMGWAYKDFNLTNN